MSVPPPNAPRNPWIVSRPFDLAMVLVPLLIAGLVLFLPKQESETPPLWGFLFLVVAFDVAHVWSTVYISYLDPDAMRRKRWLFLLPIPLSFVLAYRVHLHSPTLFWTLLAYVAIYHFIKQQYGFIALYKARARERSQLDYSLDRWTLWVGALGPVLIWHASPSKHFDWFNAGESFITRIDPAFRTDLVIVMAVTAAAWIARQLRNWFVERRFNPGKTLWMSASWLSWSVGLGYPGNPLVSIAFINLLHGIPFLLIVWYRCNHRWEQEAEEGSRFLRWLSARKRWLVFYLLVFALALGEAGLWDSLVWQVYLPEHVDGPFPRLTPTELSFWVAVLSLPQIVHYFLDAWLWKLNGTNPDLESSLAGR